MQINNLCLNLYQYLFLTQLKKIIATIRFLYWQKAVFLIAYFVQPKGVVDGEKPLKFSLSKFWVPVKNLAVYLYLTP